MDINGDTLIILGVLGVSAFMLDRHIKQQKIVAAKSFASTRRSMPNLVNTLDRKSGKFKKFAAQNTPEMPKTGGKFFDLSNSKWN